MNTIKTIITGHGKFASGIKSSLQLLSNIPDSYRFCDFLEEMSEEQLYEQIEKLIEPNEPVLFFTDLTGGTPYKIAAGIAYHRGNVEVVSGGNIGSLLETSFNEYEDVAAYAEDIVTVSKKFTVRFSLSENGDDDSEDEPTDGI